MGPVMDVVCTAGHVDHGKSTLVRALTGMEPDRFAEERRRGLTIDLGFAWAEITAGDDTRTVAFVDLPGHERFIANMLAGAGPVECALLVVAADEGWMPQTQEHVDILALLEVGAGVVAITKADTVDAGQVAAVRDDVHRRLAGSPLADAPTVTVSAARGEGLDDLRAALLQALQRRPQPGDAGRPRLWVDRSFSMKGAGTVVTGTLAGGHLRTADDVVVLPGGTGARIRSLQSLKTDVSEAAPGARVAVNLVGVSRADVSRGDAVVRPGQWFVTTQIDAWVRALPGSKVAQRGAWHLHAGSGEWVVKVRPLSAPAITEGGYARITLREPAPLVAGDRFVLREAGRRATIGGGVVLDVVPPPLDRTHPWAGRLEALELRRAALRDGDRAALLVLHTAERGAAELVDVAAAVGLTDDAARAAAGDARLLGLGSAVAHPQAAARWSQAVRTALQAHHTAHPVDRSAPRDVAVRAAVDAGCPPALATQLVDVLISVGRVAAEGSGVRHPDHAVRLDPGQQRARDALLAALEAEPLRPPRLADAARDANANAALVRELTAAGELIPLTPDIAMTAGAVTAAAERLRAAYATEGPLTAARAKEIWATSRKYAVPLLEELDRRGITRRRGDLRDVL